MQMDKYDFMIIDIIQNFKLENQNHIRLSVLERNFWKRIEADTDLHVGQARIGERITNLYLDGLIQNKDGYTLTKKGREQLAFAPWNKPYTWRQLLVRRSTSYRPRQNPNKT